MFLVIRTITKNMRDPFPSRYLQTVTYALIHIRIKSDIGTVKPVKSPADFFN